MLLTAGIDFETCVLAVGFFPPWLRMYLWDLQDATGCFTNELFFFHQAYFNYATQIKMYHFSSIPFALFPPLCFIELFFVKFPFLNYSHLPMYLHQCLSLEDHTHI